ncbi:MAG TPA: hypothetical protein VKB93_17995 [Thermoanaerobaculia bacterium]|nr:hypothetical protein [Thermoanaerobaculia bacterium]
MLPATDVIIFFVGLTMWSERLPNDYGVKAILPRITAASSGVENHKAAIIFPAASFVEGWEQPSVLRSAAGETSGPGGAFKFVFLDGETLRFDTNGAGNTDADLSDVTLPGLQQLCPERKALRSGYQTPYEGAAAVVLLPKGTLKTCLTLPAESEGRLDTRLALQTNGELVITATNGSTKRLRLKPVDGSIKVMIANLPELYYDGTATGEGISHVHAYYDMSEPGTASCPMNLREWWNRLEDPDGIFLCDADTFAPARPSASRTRLRQIADSLSTSAANFECSNTQWP